MKSWLRDYWPAIAIILVLAVFVGLLSWSINADRHTAGKHCANLLAIVHTAQDSIKIYQIETACHTQQ